MLTKIISLQNVGLFENGAPLPVPFERTTLIYAENGRGKSTIASLLRACSDGDGKRLQAKRTLDGAANPTAQLLFSFAGKNESIEFANGSWNRSVPNIVVFDGEFVEQNVYSGYEVRPDQRQALLEFALGDQSVELKRDIEVITAKISAANAKRGEAEKRIAGFARQMPLPLFIGLHEVHDAQQQVDGLRRRIEATKNSRALLERQDPKQLNMLTFDVASFGATLAKQLPDIEAVAEATVQQHLAKHQHPSGIENWVSGGLPYALEEGCPFCGQPLEGVPLIAAYQSYFNKAYSDLKGQVSLLRKQVETSLADSVIDALSAAAATNTARVESWKDHLDLVSPRLTVEQLRHAIGEARALAIGRADQKQGQPLEAFWTEEDRVSIVALLDRINTTVGDYNTHLATATQRIAEFKGGLVNEDAQALEKQIRILELSMARHSPDAVKVIGEYQLADTERKQLDRDKTQVRGELDQLMTVTLAQYQGKINTLLGKFGAGFTIEKMQPTYQGTGEPRTDYVLRLRQQPVALGSRKEAGPHFGTTLSDGDKRTLAFAFFLAKLEPANLGNQILVLDDPVSSLDRNRRAQSVEQIVFLAPQCAQMIVLSHDAYFVREVRERLTKVGAATAILGVNRVQNDYSAFGTCDIDDICASEYYRHHQQLTEFVQGRHKGNLRDVAKAIRPFLEGYCHRRFPGLLPTHATFGAIVFEIANAPAASPIANLKHRVAELSEVNDYASRFHHDTNPGGAEMAVVTDAELRHYVERALRFVYAG